MNFMNYLNQEDSRAFNFLYALNAYRKALKTDGENIDQLRARVVELANEPAFLHDKMRKLTDFCESTGHAYEKIKRACQGRGKLADSLVCEKRGGLWYVAQRMSEEDL